MSLANHLHERGWVTVQIYDESELVHQRNKFIQELMNMPEFKNGREMYEANRPFVLGAFSALGNPSSFHNHTIRNTRMDCHLKAKTAVFDDFLREDDDLKMEQLIDRMLCRPKGVRVGGESKHRDESKYAKPDDLIFGGWVNYDDFSHTFRTCPGSHMDREAIGSTKGFNKIPNDSGHVIEIIEVPPGHLLIFWERMVHEVANIKTSVKMHRVFIGFRLTKDIQSLHKDGTMGLCKDLIKMNTMDIKSGQTPRMWSSNHWSFPKNREKIKDISNDMVPAVLEDLKVKSTGEDIKAVPGHMKSLEDYGMLATYRKYYPREVAMHLPHRNLRWPTRIRD